MRTGSSELNQGNHASSEQPCTRRLLITHFAPIIQHKDLPMLKGAHCASIRIEVWVCRARVEGN